jgi:hypothetical protein
MRMLSWLYRLFRWRQASSFGRLSALDSFSDMELLRFLDAQTDPMIFPQVEEMIRHHFHLHRLVDANGEIYHGAELRSGDLKRLSANPELAAVLIFHGDGWIREAALRTLNSPLSRSIVAYGLMSRLNDWSPQVRAAASSAFDRCLRTADPDVLAPAIWIVLRNGLGWGRWPDGYFAFVDKIMAHDGLVSVLANHVVGEKRGGNGAVFRAMCSSPAFDHFLLQIAGTAQQAHIRADALNFLAAGRALWPLGTVRKVWVDKSMGKYRMVSEYGSRTLSISCDIAETLRVALDDRSVAVRKEALDALTTQRDDTRLKHVITHSFEQLGHDRHPSVRNRLAYLKQKMS